MLQSVPDHVTLHMPSTSGESRGLVGLSRLHREVSLKVVWREEESGRPCPMAISKLYRGALQYSYQPVRLQTDGEDQPGLSLLLGS